MIAINRKEQSAWALILLFTIVRLAVAAYENSIFETILSTAYLVLIFKVAEKSYGSTTALFTLMLTISSTTLFEGYSNLGNTVPAMLALGIIYLLIRFKVDSNALSYLFFGIGFAAYVVTGAISKPISVILINENLFLLFAVLSLTKPKLLFYYLGILMAVTTVVPINSATILLLPIVAIFAGNGIYMTLTRLKGTSKKSMVITILLIVAALIIAARNIVQDILFSISVIA